MSLTGVMWNSAIINYYIMILEGCVSLNVSTGCCGILLLSTIT